MAELPKDPTGYALEDLIAAHFVSRGCYVETGIKERNPDEILELDLVWTDYRQEPQRGRPVEVKSGDWGLGDVFKFHGWTTYLGLRDALFVHKEPCGRISPSCLAHVAKGTGIQLLHVPTPADAEAHLEKMGLKKPHWDELPEVWRFSFWAQRGLLKALNAAVKHGVCSQSAKAAKEYHQLINDAVFFVPDPRDRVGELLSAHFGHQSLGLTAAQEIETGKVDFEDPAETRTFNRILYDGQHFPAQTCLYLAHRARLYVLKAVVDYWLARERGDIKERTIKFGKMLIDLTSGRLSTAMARGAEELSEAKTFRLFPVFWQVFPWSWGGFLLKDRADQEFSDLERETGVARDEIPLALQAFDKLFPTAGGCSKKWAVFVHGCYWHHHAGCYRATVPTRNRTFWLAKFRENRRRDRRVVSQLEAAGFTVAVVWECEMTKPRVLAQELSRVVRAGRRGVGQLQR